MTFLIGCDGPSCDERKPDDEVATLSGESLWFTLSRPDIRDYDFCSFKCLVEFTQNKAPF